MLEVKHTVEIIGLDKLLEALQGLRPSGASACCESNHSVSAPAPETAPVQQPQPAPVQQPMPIPQVPVAPPVQQTAPVPTSAPSYDLSQISLAAAQLRDAGKMSELLALLPQFGVQMVTQLPPERYGEFATALRGLGAKI